MQNKTEISDLVCSRKRALVIKLGAGGPEGCVEGKGGVGTCPGEAGQLSPVRLPRAVKSFGLGGPESGPRHVGREYLSGRAHLRPAGLPVLQSQGANGRVFRPLLHGPPAGSPQREAESGRKGDGEHEVSVGREDPDSRWHQADPCGGASVMLTANTQWVTACQVLCGRRSAGERTHILLRQVFRYLPGFTGEDPEASSDLLEVTQLGVIGQACCVSEALRGCFFLAQSRLGNACRFVSVISGLAVVFGWPGDPSV